MWNSLFDFYKSKEWRAVLASIKMERLNENGETICEYCGRPIVKAYDIIGHHKTELTHENVNDATISLNPDNVQLVHHRCHNYIHNKLGYSMREVFLVYGAPCSGKSAWVRNNMEPGDLVVNMDEIWRCVSGMGLYKKPNRLKAVVFRTRDQLYDVVRYRVGKWNNAYIVGGFPLQSERERMLKEMGAREVFIDATMEECIQRARATEGMDADEYEGYIRKWFETYRASGA